MKEWRDRERWARQSYFPSTFLLTIYGGGTMALCFKYSFLSGWPPFSWSLMAFLAWGIFGSLASIYFIYIIRKARRELRGA